MSEAPERTPIDEVFSKDSEHVYYEDSSGGKPKILKEAEPATFKVLDEYVSKDATNVYITEPDGGDVPKKLRRSVDVESFVLFPKSEYAKDKDMVYCRGFSGDHLEDDYLPVTDADPSTFVGVSGPYGKDTSNVYYSGRRMEGIDPKSFEVLLESYPQLTRDANGIYEGERRLPVDPQSFEILPEGTYGSSKDVYAKDVHGVYSLRTQFGSKGFHTIKEAEGEVSGESVIIDGKKINADPATYVQVSESYGKDKNHVYFLGDKRYRGIIEQEVMEGVDPATFEFFTYYAKDMYQAYWEIGGLESIPGADAATFEALGSGYAKDKDRAYYNDGYGHSRLVLADADPNTFVVDTDHRAHDSVHAYLEGELVPSE